MFNYENLTNIAYALALVLFTIVFMSFILKKAKKIIGVNTNILTTLSTMAVGAKERVVLLQVDNKNILIGVTGQNIRTLYVSDSSETVDNKIELKKIIPSIDSKNK